MGENTGVVIEAKWDTAGIDTVIEKVDKLNGLLRETHKLIHDLQTNYNYDIVTPFE